MYNTVEEYSQYREKLESKIYFLKQKLQAFLSMEKGIFEYKVYMDSILVDCRALFLENVKYKHNYTLQNHYRRFGLDLFAAEIDKFLEIEIVKGYSIKEGIKTYVDRFLVHYDDVSNEEIKLKDELLKIFTNGLGDYHIAYIIINLLEYKKNADKDILLQSLEWLTQVPEGVELDKLSEEDFG